MSWIFFVLGFHFLWAIGNSGDKFVVEKKIKNPLVYTQLMETLGIVGLVIVPFISFSLPSFMEILLIALASLFWFWADVEYVKALQLEEVSRVNILWGLISVFSLLIGWFFIGEILNNKELVAFFILLLGTITASLHVNQKRLRFSGGFWHMAFACFLYASYAITIRKVTGGVSPWIVFVLSMAFVFLWSLLLFLKKSFRHDMGVFVKKKDLNLYLFLFVLAILNTTAHLLNIHALSLAPAALVLSLSGFQAFFVFLIAIFVTKFYPNLFKEKFDLKNFSLKLIALFFLMIGLVFLSLA